MNKKEFEEARNMMIESIKEIDPDAYDSLFKKHEFMFVDLIKIMSNAEAYAYRYAQENAMEALDTERAKALVSVIEDVLMMGFAHFQEEMMEKYIERH